MAQADVYLSFGKQHLTSCVPSKKRNLRRLYMKGLLLVLSLLFATSLLAQQPSQPGSNPSDTVTSPQTIQGCLQASGSRVTLIDDTGATYQVEGPSAKLQEHVGHEVQLAGTIGRPSSSTSSSSTSDVSQRVIQVLDIKHVASHCSSKK